MNPSSQTTPSPSNRLLQKCSNISTEQKTEAAKKKPPEPIINKEHHQEALATAWTPMFASKSSDIQVAPMPGVEFIDAAKYRAYLGVKDNQGEEAATASAALLPMLHKIR